jgi:ABC-type dipeptide/oligopeptide/nickel transport system permease subunit
VSDAEEAERTEDAADAGSAGSRRLLRRLGRHRGVQLGVLILVVWVALALLARPLTGYDPETYDPSVGLRWKLLHPAWSRDAPLPPEAPQALLGTDKLGKDVLGLVLHGARYSLGIGLVAVAVSLLVGVPLGLVSGYSGGVLDGLVMRGTDIVMAFPAILFAISIVAVLGQSLPNLVLAVGLTGAPSIVRQVRAQVLVIRELEYVQAARALGFGHLRILGGHVLPNCLGPILVLATLGTAGAILETAGLGFVGLGAEPGTPEWGLMIAENRALVERAPWCVLTPGAAIVLLVLGFNLLGDGLRDVLDPRQRV